MIAGDRDGSADLLERLLDRAPVAHPVVEHRDRGAVGSLMRSDVPLVLGTPDSVGSSATAARSARATALKIASIM